MNSITVNSRIVADLGREQVWLKSLLGEYELNFNFSLQGLPQRDEEKRWVILNTARISAKTMKGRECELGLSTLETPLSIKTSPEHSIHEQVTFHLSLTSVQLSQLENMRDGQDIEFKIMTRGMGGDGKFTNPVHDEWRVKVSRSDWIEKLKQINYMDIMLIEVPMLPKGQLSDDWLDVKVELQEAQDSFLNRKYANCVAQCRRVMEDAGHLKFGEDNWCNPLLNLIGKSKRSADKEERNRESMSKEERENAIWASLFHYTHQANHGKSKGGESGYSREEAKLILTMTAAFIGR